MKNYKQRGACILISNEAKFQITWSNFLICIGTEYKVNGHMGFSFFQDSYYFLKHNVWLRGSTRKFSVNNTTIHLQACIIIDKYALCISYAFQIQFWFWVFLSFFGPLIK